MEVVSVEGVSCVWLKCGAPMAVAALGLRAARGEVAQWGSAVATALAALL